MKVIITGATGMVGEGVLMECIQHPDVEEILLINRRTSGVKHSKVKEILHSDFFDLSSFESHLTGYDACFFCLGVSSLGMKEPEYTKLTHNLTMHVAQTLSRLNSSLVFCYVSGAGTDSSEKGRLMWAKVKGKTENDLRNLNFKAAYGFRPGFIIPTKGAKNVLPAYKYVKWLVPVLRPLFPGMVGSLTELGNAMINAVKYAPDTKVLEVKDIRDLSLRS